MVSQKIASVITAFSFILQHYYTLGTGFSCDFGTLDANTHQGLSDCDVIHPYGKRWHVISGAEYSSLYWLDTTWKRNGGFYLTWTRDPNGKSIFRLPNYQMTKPFATLSFYYKFFGVGQSRMRVRLCDDVIFDVTNEEERWLKSPDLEICCYEEGWNRPDISFEVEWTPQSGRVAIDSINVISMTRTEINYSNGVRRRKPDQQKGNLETLANVQEQSQESSAQYQPFHAIKKPSETPKKKSNVGPHSSSDDSQCYSERRLKGRLGLSEEYRNNKPRVLAGGTGENAALQYKAKFATYDILHWTNGKD
nr:uncharacterized protein LOC129280492 [Lytechinus pictus]